LSHIQDRLHKVRKKHAKTKNGHNIATALLTCAFENNVFDDTHIYNIKYTFNFVYIKQ